MADGRKTDRLTVWWRGISLRAKVTGVTVGILVVGLLGVGAGATVFLRNALIANLDTTLEGLVRTDVAGSVFDIESADQVTQKQDVPPTDFFVALYGPAEPWSLLASGGGSEPEPDFPPTFELGKAVMSGTDPFALEDAETGANFRASVAPLEVAGVTGYFTQLVALPLAGVNRVVATFLGIYSILAVITVFAAALGTRWLVTLTFRSLGQVEATAMSIAAGDFSQRMTDIDAGTEVGKLKTAINAMLGRVDSALSQRDATVRQMRRFIGDASHELRTPLVTVRGYAELYRMGAISGDEQIAQSMERIEKEAIRMGVLVEDLLALARLDERRGIVVTAVDLRPIARDAALDARASSPLRRVTVVDTTKAEPDATSSPLTMVPGEAIPPRRRSAGPSTSALGIAGATISRLRRRPRGTPAAGGTAARGNARAQATPGDDTTADGVPQELALPAAPIVLGDENRIRQVVANLLGNARRYSAPDSPIDLAVGVDRLAGMGWIAVSDHGEGVPEQIRDKIFQRFWRADTSRARETGGSGLGLAIVASIVEALHGTISVADTPGGGATFRVAFPLAEGQDAAEHLFIETQPLSRLTEPDA